MGRGVVIDAKNGPERERFSAPDASWGHRSAVSTRRAAGFCGYKIHAAIAEEDPDAVAPHATLAEPAVVKEIKQRAEAEGEDE